MLVVTKDMPPLLEERFPLRLQRCGKGGWFFITCDAIPGLSAFGPELECLFNDLEIAGADLLKSRGHNVVRLKVEAVPATDTNSWAVADKFELTTKAA